MFSCRCEGEEFKVPSLKSFILLVLKKGVKCHEHEIELSPPLGAGIEAETNTADQSDEVEVVRERSSLSIKSLKELLKDDHIDINEVQSTGLSMLMFACLAGREDSVKLLIKKGVSLTLADNDGWNALHYAVWGQNLGCIKSILSVSQPTFINGGDSRGMTPLMIAVNRGGLRIIQTLIKKGGDPFAIDANERTVLHWAITSKHVSIVKFLLDKYLSGVEHRLRADSDGATALHYASVIGGNEILHLLLSTGFDPSVQDSHSQVQGSFPYSLANGLTPMHWACALSSDDAVTALLDHQGSLVNVLSRQHLTPLHVGGCIGSVELCGKLISLGAMVNAIDSNGMTPLHLACLYGHLDCVKLLLEKAADIDALSKTDNSTGLHLASQEGHNKVIDCLLENGSLRDRVAGTEGNSPIHLGAIHGRSKVIETLLRDGCSVDLLRESDSRTSLHLSACHGHIECCTVLLEGGANINRRDSTIEGLGSLDVAWLNNQRECSDYLITQGAKTLGGRVHRAACTIQLSWRYHVHKRRRRVTLDWAARVIQYSIRRWMMRQRARRLMRIRERRKQESAKIIQRRWRDYANRKRELEESYLALKTKLSHEYMAAHLIISELSLQESSINLPPATAASQGHTSSSSLRRSTQFSAPPLPHTAQLLRSSIRPTPLFPAEGLLFQQKPKTPLLKQPLIKVRINTVPIMGSISDGVRKGSHTAPMLTEDDLSYHLQANANPLLDAKGGDDRPCSKVHGLVSPRHQAMEDGLLLPSVSDPVQRGNPCHQSSSAADKHSDTVRLPSVESKTGSSSTVQTKSTELQKQDVAHSTILPPLSSSSSSLVTKKNVTGRGDKSFETSKGKDVLQQGSQKRKTVPIARRIDRNKQKSKREEDGGRERNRERRDSREDALQPKKKTTKSFKDELLLVQHAHRYDKLQQVTLLLEQAKNLRSLSGDSDGSYDELKTQIQSALEEAIRLRVDTEAMYDKASVKN